MRPYYQDAYATLYLGDCREVWPALGIKADHVVTDPPYDPKTHAGARSHGGKTSFITFDAIDPAWVVPLLSRAAHRWVIAFCAMEMLGSYATLTTQQAASRWVRAGFWHRTDGSPQFSGDRPAQPGEGIAIWHGEQSGKMRWNGGGKRAYYSYGVVRGAARVHETQKPVGLIKELLADFTDTSDMVADLFAGSGTTGVAAKEMGQRSILVELDEARCEQAAKRLAATDVSLYAGYDGRTETASP